MRFFRRPLLVVFISLIVLIRIWYWLEGEGTHESVFQEGQPVECVGRIEEIQVRASGSSIILSGIKPDSVRLDFPAIYLHGSSATVMFH